tara:strand:+ start:166 stop:384 length:219 start_codon:yes stop_codon:yes gene_type:complete
MANEYKKGQVFIKGKGYFPVGSNEHKDYLKNFKTKAQKRATAPIGKLKEQKQCNISGGKWVSGKCIMSNLKK